MLHFLFQRSKFVATPNFNERRDGKVPRYIILHYTDTKDTQEALDFMMDPQREVSAHYVVERDGALIQMVRDQDRAWHAGHGYWRGERDMNSASLGIEIVNPGHTYGHEPFPAVQIKSVVRLCRRLMKKWRIPADNVLAHSDIAPGRKQDPGHLFPWQDLAAQGVGVWPDPQALDFTSAPEILSQDKAFAGLLRQYGYDPDADIRDVIAAFHRRFYPEKFIEGADPVIPDVVSVARMLALLRKECLHPLPASAKHPG